VYEDLFGFPHVIECVFMLWFTAPSSHPKKFIVSQTEQQVKQKQR